MTAAQPYLHTPEQWAAAYTLAAVAACLIASGLLWLAYVLIVPADHRRSTADVAHVRDLGARLVEPMPAEYEHLALSPGEGRALGARSPKPYDLFVAGGAAVHALPPAPELYDQRRDVGWMQQLLTPSSSPGPESSRGPGDTQTVPWGSWTEAPGHYDGDGCTFPAPGHLVPAETVR